MSSSFVMVPDSVRTTIDDHLVTYAAKIIATIATEKKISPQYLALAVPGVCHTHAPSKKRKFDDCAFCERRGNCFAADDDDPDASTSPPGDDDLVAKHVDRIADALTQQLRLFRQDIEDVIERVRGIVIKKA